MKERPISLILTLLGKRRISECSFTHSSEVVVSIVVVFDLAISFNQPIFCPDASWNETAITFVSSNTTSYYPSALFINRKDTLFVIDSNHRYLLIWNNGSVNPTTISNIASYSSMSLFVNDDGEIFVPGGYYASGSVFSVSGVNRWTSSGTWLSSPISPTDFAQCYGLFIDISNNLYCSQQYEHQVIRKSLMNPSVMLSIVGGVGCSGSASHMLNTPAGIFVTLNLDLYVADSKNDRVQLFRSGEINATTAVGIEAPGTFIIFRPTGIAMDADGYLFIVDQMNHRVIGSGPGGYRCVVGCSESGGVGSNRFNQPTSMSFDSAGNIFVNDWGNNRVQKFFLSNNSCGR
jgi:hypothetical protein